MSDVTVVAYLFRFCFASSAQYVETLGAVLPIAKGKNHSDPGGEGEGVWEGEGFRNCEAKCICVTRQNNSDARG